MGETIPGLYLPIVIDGTAMDRGPKTISIPCEVAETAQRAFAANLLVDALDPFDGAPERIRKMTATLEWDSILGPDIRRVNRLIARGTARIAIWFQVTESYWCPAGTATGTLMRSSAYDVLGAPAGTGTDYEPTAELDDETPMAITLGTPDAEGKTVWTGTTLGAPARVNVHYYPLAYFRVGVDAAAFPLANQWQQKLTLVEL
jgi:hypothetical protein